MMPKITPRQKKFAELDCKENLILVNHNEHIAGKFDTREWKNKFWLIQVERYGIEHMENWIKNLPPKLDKKRIDFLQEAEVSYER